MSESFVGFFPFRGLSTGSVKPAEQNKIRCQGDARDSYEGHGERFFPAGIHDISIF